MSAICIIDTSVFCPFLRVPNMDAEFGAVAARMSQYIEGGYTLLLPVAAIFETGNHIAQNGDGRLRRQAAQRFATVVQDSLSGNAPWTTTPLFERDTMSSWLRTFPEQAVSAVSFGDVSILSVFEAQCRLHKYRTGVIWAHDKHLSGYRREVKQ